MRSRDLADRFRTADTVLFISLIALSVAGLLSVKVLLPRSADVMVESGGRLVYVLSLDEETRREIPGPLGVTVVEIRDRKVRVTGSPCENKNCVGQGWIRDGVIVCLPNRITVSVGTRPVRSGHVDAVSG